MAGLPEETDKDALADLGFTFVNKWEETPNNEPRMRQMMAERVKDSAKLLIMPNPVKYLRKAFMDAIKNQDYSIGLGLSWIERAYPWLL